MPKADAAMDWLRLTERMPPADDFGAESSLVKRKADDGGRKSIEFDSDDRQGIIEEDQLQELGRATDEPDIEPGDPSYRSDARQPHQCQSEAEDDAADHGNRGDLDGGDRALQQERLDHIGGKLFQNTGHLALPLRGNPQGGRGSAPALRTLQPKSSPAPIASGSRSAVPAS